MGRDFGMLLRAGRLCFRRLEGSDVFLRLSEESDEPGHFRCEVADARVFLDIQLAHGKRNSERRFFVWWDTPERRDAIQAIIAPLLARLKTPVQIQLIIDEQGGLVKERPLVMI